ncbi:MAG TPA: SDR family oxidoreductase [Candidatus Acidoferrum sp.]|nr:SDR family oxidoreductase [Candidatus Acidoferrum sp.]
MRILVTGGSGYLGSILVPRLTSERHEVDVLDIQPPTSSVRWLNADVNTADSGMFRTYDAIVHLAGIVGDAACNKEPTKAVETNYLTTKRLAKEFARSNKKMVFASTCSVYGASNSLQTENTDPSPLSLYGLTKLQSEKPVIDAGGVVLRFATLHGNSPRMRFDLVVNEFVRRAVVDKKIAVFGGAQIRPFLHVSDAAAAISAVITGESGVYNVGSENMTILDLANRIKDKTQCDIEIVAEITDKRSYAVDSSKITRKLGLQYKKKIEDTVDELTTTIGKRH